MESEKNKLGLGILVGILIALVIGMAGFIVYDKFLEEENNQGDNSGVTEGENNNQQPQLEIKELSLESTIVQSLSKVFYVEEENYAMSRAHVFHVSDKLNASELSMQTKFGLIMAKLNHPMSINEEDFKEEYKLIFGSLEGYNNLEYLNVCPIYKFENNSYVMDLEAGCGGTSNVLLFAKLIEAKEITENGETRIEIIEAFAAGEVALDTGDVSYYKYYKDYDNKEYVETYSELRNPLDIDYSKYGKYKYTFVKNSEGIYAFTSVEKIQ